MARKEKKASADGAEKPTQPGTVITPGSPAMETTGPAGIATDPAPTAAAAAAEPPTTSTADGDGISWTASEFVAHEKSAGWYLSLAAAAAALAAVIYLLTRDAISAVVILVGALVLGIYGARKPRQLDYRLDSSGVTIGSKHHIYEEFRSFGVVAEGAFSSIVFMPLKRFAPLTTIYYAPEDEDKIIKLLSDQLPFQEHSHDIIDRLMLRIRF